jgi:hypothetical protein|tara:strand:+ start:162 stop:905 length:744 start_codon:yes stop_codon:yes gene_type:complete
MTKNYDPDLRNRLPANNNESGVVLNSNFEAWTEHIDKVLSHSLSCGSRRYREEPDSKLLVSYKDHASRYQRAQRAENTVMLTHPFYLHLSHMGEIRSEGVRREVGEYLDNLLKLLNLNRVRSEVGMVALETIHHYAAATSLLLEAGLIDRVIFTERDRGCILDKEELEEFGENDVFFCGGYNRKCLTSSIGDMEDVSSPNRIWAVEDLVLNSPEDYNETLRTGEVRGVAQSRVIGLDKAVQKLKLAS